MTYDTLRLIRNILLRTFAVGFVFALLLGLLVVGGWDSWMGLAGQWLHVDAATLAPIIVQLFVTIRFFLVFIVLAPGLAIHWTLKKEQGN